MPSPPRGPSRATRAAPPPRPSARRRTPSRGDPLRPCAAATRPGPRRPRCFPGLSAAGVDGSGGTAAPQGVRCQRASALDASPRRLRGRWQGLFFFLTLEVPSRLCLARENGGVGLFRSLPSNITRSLISPACCHLPPLPLFPTLRLRQRSCLLEPAQAPYGRVTASAALYGLALPRAGVSCIPVSRTTSRSAPRGRGQKQSCSCSDTRSHVEKPPRWVLGHV